MKKTNLTAVCAAILLVISPAPVPGETPILQKLSVAAESVVQIQAENARVTRSPTAVQSMKFERTGTGVLIHPDGWIAANAHTVLQAARIRVMLPDGQVFSAQPALADRAHDLVLLKINAGTPLPALVLADSSKVALRSRIYSIGGSTFLRNTFSEGKVTGIGISRKEKKISGPGQTAYLFQINLDLYRGDSGSPVFNEDGEMIGIISAAAKRRGRKAYAVASNLIAERLNGLLRPA